MKLKLSEELRKKYKKKRFNVRTGDQVKIMRGDFKNHVGKIIETIDSKFIIEGVQVEKQDGTKVTVPVDASNCMLVEISLSDDRRREELNA